MFTLQKNCISLKFDYTHCSQINTRSTQIPIEINSIYLWSPSRIQCNTKLPSTSIWIFMFTLNLITVSIDLLSSEWQFLMNCVMIPVIIYNRYFVVPLWAPDRYQSFNIAKIRVNTQAMLLVSPPGFQKFCADCGGVEACVCVCVRERECVSVCVCVSVTLLVNVLTQFDVILMKIQKAPKISWLNSGDSSESSSGFTILKGIDYTFTN